VRRITAQSPGAGHSLERLSCPANGHGRRRFRYKPEKQRYGNSHGDTGNSHSDSSLQALLDEVRRDRDRLQRELDKERLERELEREERKKLVQAIAEQAVAVRTQGEQIKLLTDQRERRPWWDRLFSRKS
jgi:predicted  nucleic acid-binding Zn-ribbon protein